ncbi:MAG: hypothetical protein JSR39_06115 [Verrucomicrobia bacterium]|nr:hypothetical protein [Verrucomicrobiota bacterium]
MEQPSSVIDEIPFFDTSSSCIAYYKNSCWAQKALSLIQSFGTFFLCIMDNISFALHGSKSVTDSLTTPPTEGFSKRKLVVCIHGLNGQPSQFDKVVNQMQEEDLSDTDLFTPSVLQRGCARLDEMVAPILETIGDWARTGGDKELVLVGFSNGGRIARAIEAELIHSGRIGNIQQIRFVSIAGACKGSSIANIMTLDRQFGLSIKKPSFLTGNILEEIPTTSERTAQLNQRWQEARQRPNAPRSDYTFIAAPHDWCVPNFDSTLMETNSERSRYAIIRGQGHCSIISRSAKAVASIILNSPPREV